MKFKLEEINGNEIIDFLNSINGDDDSVCDISPVLRSFVFDDQKIAADRRYVLEFAADYNNWGTHQPIDYNLIYMTENDVRVCLNEPFDGDGSSETLEKLLKEWLEGHKFSHDVDNDFYVIINDVRDRLSQRIVLSNIEVIEELINKLKKAQNINEKKILWTKRKLN